MCKCFLKTTWFFVISLVLAFNASGGQFGSLEFDYIQRTIVITGSVGQPTEVVIPAEIEGRAVTHIGASAFAGSQLKSVTLPETIIRIAGLAFSGSRLLEIHIPEGIEEIETSTFSNCIQLKSVTGGVNVTQIGPGAFYNCRDLQLISFNRPLAHIGLGAFNGCESLGPDITLPETLETMGTSAFYNCDGIFKITILSKKIVEYHIATSKRVFAECDRVEEVHVDRSVSRNSDFAKYLGLEWMFPDSFFPLDKTVEQPQTNLSVSLVPQISLLGKSGNTVILEVAESPEGPWSLWKSIVLGEDGKNRIVIDEGDNHRFYRVRD